MTAFATRSRRSPPSDRWGKRDLLRLNAYSFGIAGFILAMDTVVIPVLVLEVAPEAAKNTLLGVLGLIGLGAAALVQVPVGWASDRTRSRIGRRLPYLLWTCLCIPVGLAGLALPLNYVSLLVIWLFIQINAGIGYSPYLASVRELVPPGPRGRFGVGENAAGRHGRSHHIVCGGHAGRSLHRARNGLLALGDAGPLWRGDFRLRRD